MIPRCPRCRRPASSAQWVRFKNGTVHLSRWCCGKKVGTPIPRNERYRFGLESYEQAFARFTVENDQDWLPLPERP
jgi:hypothetical protein